jgi:hypothetical protein
MDHALSFVRLNERKTKPRTLGLTEILGPYYTCPREVGPVCATSDCNRSGCAERERDAAGLGAQARARATARSRRSVRGVKSIADQLTVYKTAEGVFELQDSKPRRGERADRFRIIWAPGARVAVTATGGTLALLAWRSNSGADNGCGRRPAPTANHEQQTIPRSCRPKLSGRSGPSEDNHDRRTVGSSAASSRQCALRHRHTLFQHQALVTTELMR